MTDAARWKLILEKLGEIMARLDDVDARLTRIEAQGPAADGKTARAKAGGKGVAAE
jgi:hypothetical protein